MAEPVLVGLLFADRVITEHNGQRGLIGIFNGLRAPKFPVAFPPWFIYSAVTNLLPGKHSFTLNLICDATNQVIVSLTGEFETAESSQGNELVSVIGRALFPQAGTYTLSFHVDGDYVGARNLEVKPLEKNP